MTQDRCDSTRFGRLAAGFDWLHRVPKHAAHLASLATHCNDSLWLLGTWRGASRMLPVASCQWVSTPRARQQMTPPTPSCGIAWKSEGHGKTRGEPSIHDRQHWATASALVRTKRSGKDSAASTWQNCSITELCPRRTWTLKCSHPAKLENQRQCINKMLTYRGSSWGINTATQFYEHASV